MLTCSMLIKKKEEKNKLRYCCANSLPRNFPSCSTRFMTKTSFPIRLCCTGANENNLDC